MLHVKLIKGEKGMLELKEGGSIQIHTEKKNLKLKGLWWREGAKESEVLALVSEMCTSLWHTIHLAKNAFYKTFFGHQTYPIKCKLLHLGYNRDVLYAPKIGMK